MVTCSSCGYEKNKDDKKFCIKCGKPLVHTVKNEPTVLPFKPIEEDEATSMTSVKEEQLHEEKTKSDRIVCSNCGYKKNKEGRKFCIKCGKQLAYTAVKEAAILPFEPIPDEEEEFPVLEQAEELHEEVTEEVFVPEQAEDLSEEAMEEISVPEQAEELPEEVTAEISVPEQAEELPEEVTEEISVLEQAEELPEEVTEEIHVSEQAEELPEEVTEEIHVPEQVEELPEEVTEEIPVLKQAEELSEQATEEIPVPEQVEELPKKKQNPYLKYVIALIVILIILGVLIIALIPDREEASELNNAEITTASETTYELTSGETTITTEQPATVSETTLVTTVTTVAETTTTLPVITTVSETTITAETTTESVATTAETTTVPVTTTTVVTTVPKTEASTVKTTVTAAKNQTSDEISRELLTPLDKVPEYTRYKKKRGGYFDEIDYEFILDESVVGKWEVIGVYDGEPSEYESDKLIGLSEHWVRFNCLAFFENGIVDVGGNHRFETVWTLGLVCDNFLRGGEARMCEYELWRIDGKEYLFFVNKDWNYNESENFDLVYYVMERTGPAEPVNRAPSTIAPTEEITVRTPQINTSDGIKRELITPLDEVPSYERMKTYNGIVDKIDYNFVVDETVIGEWTTVDFISSDPSEYDPSSKSSVKSYWVSGLIFDDGGIVTRKTSNGLSNYKWTFGLICEYEGIASYELWNIDGEEYLFFEWKSGDYSIRGRTDCPYYVLKRK